MNHVSRLAFAIGGLLLMAGSVTAQEGLWNGTWIGLWEERAATTVTVTAGDVVNYVYLGRSHQGFDVVVTANELVFTTDEVTGRVKLTRTAPGEAKAEFLSPNAKGKGTLTRF